jgi:hypothetical protein
VYFIIDPTEEELNHEREFAKEMEEMGDKHGFVELNNSMVTYGKYSDKISALLLNFPYDTYPVDNNIVNSFLQKLALTPAERIKRSSTHLLFDVVFVLIPSALFYTIATPFRQLAAYLLSINPDTYSVLRTPIVTFVGALISFFFYRPAFPQKNGKNNQFKR